MNLRSSILQNDSCQGEGAGGLDERGEGIKQKNIHT